MSIGRNAHKGSVGNGSGVSQVVTERNGPRRSPVNVGVGVAQNFVEFVRVKGIRLSGLLVDFVAQFLTAFLSLQFLEVVLTEGIAHAETPR